MARILYGIISVGFGHAIRSKIIIDHLESKGHKVFIITSNKTYDYYKNYYKNLYNVEGLEVVFDKNAVLNIKTVLANIKKISKKNYKKLLKLKEVIAEFDPQIVISDFETFSSYIANEKKLPLISIDNQHFLIYGDYNFPEKYRMSHFKALMIVKSLVLQAKYYMIMALEGTKIKNKTNVFQIKPLVRNEILNAKPKSMDYIFVYQSTKSYDKLIQILKRINYKFIVYGFDKNETVANLTFKKFNDQQEYLNDLINSKAVITNGGFTLISEAIYMKKPILVVPIKKHFEQILNALYVKNNKLGTFYNDLDENHVVDFISELKKYNFDKIKKWDNEQTFNLLDMLIRKETK